MGEVTAASILYQDGSKDEEAFACCRALYAATGLKVGGSSGAVLFACMHYLLDHPELRRVVCVCADRGKNYATSIFHDEWLQRQGLHISWKHFEALQASCYSMIAGVNGSLFQ